MAAIRVELYTRRGCSLCEDAKAVLLSLHAERPFALVETDVDLDFALQQAYGHLVPVIVVNGQRVSELRVDAAAHAALRRSLEGVQ